MRTEIRCDCGRVPKQIDKIRKTSGYQYTESTVGYYVMYECECGERGWEFIKQQ